LRSEAKFEETLCKSVVSKVYVVRKQWESQTRLTMVDSN